MTSMSYQYTRAPTAFPHFRDAAGLADLRYRATRRTPQVGHRVPMGARQAASLASRA